MSYARRKRQIHQAQEHEFYETDSGNGESYGGTLDDYSPSYPGPRETLKTDADNGPIPFNSYYVVSVRDNVDWAIGGVVGATKGVSSTGVTDPQTVDRHDFQGQMAVIRRMPDTNYGPVATSDHNSLLSLLYSMQEASHYFPNDISQQDIIKAV